MWIAPGLSRLVRGFSVIRLNPDRRYFQARGEQCISTTRLKSGAT
jgi:hypothetical protein